MNFFKSHPNYEQKISKISIEKISDVGEGLYLAKFEKTYDDKTVPSYLIIYNNTIILESDDITDKNLNFEILELNFENIWFDVEKGEKTLDFGLKVDKKGNIRTLELRIVWECKTEKDVGGYEEVRVCNFEIKDISYKAQIYHDRINISFSDLNDDGFEEIIISKPPLHGNWYSIDVIDGKTNKLVFSDSYHDSPILFYKNKNGTFFIPSLIHSCEKRKVYFLK